MAKKRIKIVKVQDPKYKGYLAFNPSKGMGNGAYGSTVAEAKKNLKRRWEME